MTQRITRCRSCGSNELSLVFDLGETPIANDLQRAPSEPRRYPLELMLCGSCTLLQVSMSLPPEEIFGQEYPYFSSSSPALVAHARENVAELVRAKQLGEESFVVEIASNDGYLLRHFRDLGIPALGIDPAEAPARAAREAGIDTMIDFFTAEAASAIRRSRGEADVVIANNVLAHVPDINDFVAGIALLLKPDGMAVFEFPYAVEMIRHCEFDTIYHEHIFYYTLGPLEKLFTRHGLHLNDGVPLEIHGGSLRLFVGRNPGRSHRLAELFAAEDALGTGRPAYYDEFGRRARRLVDGLHAMLQQLKDSGCRIAAYGAAAKGATLLNVMRPPAGLIEYVVDRNPFKQGKFMPGVSLPICPPERLGADLPDYTLLLTWNSAREVVRDQAAYLARGGKFIVPIPEPHILTGDAVPAA